MSCLTAVNDRALQGVAIHKPEDDSTAVEIQLSTPNLTQSDSEESTSDNGASDNTKNKTRDDSIEGGKRDREIPPLEIKFTGTGPRDVTVEPVTRISYPAALNGYTLMGCGVRTKYLIIHAYTVGLYLDMSAVTKIAAKNCSPISEEDWMNQILLDPNIPRIFRLVLNRNVTSAQYIGATLDALTPLMRGQDLDKYVCCVCFVCL